MDEEYDFILLGTGLTECILSGLFSVAKKKVLHMDRNGYYGGATASMNPLNSLYKKFNRKDMPSEERMGRGKDWNVDLIPKFLLASGQLVQLLIKTKVTNYLEFKSVEGNYVFRDGKLTKLPSTQTEALRFGMMGILEKNRFKKFMECVGNFKPDDSETHKRINPRMSMKEVYADFALSKTSTDVIGHSIALYQTDDYIEEPCPPAISKIQLYFKSMAMYGKSPYLYPLYGLGELPQSFSRLSAIHGGTYMLSKPVEYVESKNGLVYVKSTEENPVVCKKLIADPSYFPDKVKKVGQVIRAICILSHPIADTNDSLSCQIIIPQNQVGRHHDIYISLVSYAHCVAAKGKYLAIVSTTVETKVPENEIEPGLKLLGVIDEKFVDIADIHEPLTDGREDNIFISKSYDASSHFETTCADILDIYERAMGGPYEFTDPTKLENVQ